MLDQSIYTVHASIHIIVVYVPKSGDFLCLKSSVAQRERERGGGRFW